MKIEANKEDLRQLYLLLEDMQTFFHQPLNYRGSENTEKFAAKHYDSIRKLYYETVWKWLPAELQKEFTDR